MIEDMDKETVGSVVLLRAMDYRLGQISEKVGINAAKVRVVLEEVRKEAESKEGFENLVIGDYVLDADWRSGEGIDGVNSDDVHLTVEKVYSVDEDVKDAVDGIEPFRDEEDEDDS